MDPNLPNQPTPPVQPPPAEPIQPFQPPVPPTPPIQPAPVMPPAPKKVSGILIAGLILLFISVLALVGYYFFQTSQLKVNVSTPTPLAVASLSPIATINPTADWQTYINTKYAYQLKYPTDWLVQAMGGTQQVSQISEANFRATADETPAESGFKIAVTPDPKNLSLTDWVTTQNSDNGITFSSTTKTNSSIVSINGLNWEQVDDKSIDYVPTGFVKYGIAQGGNLYYVVIYSADIKIVDQILSTFKFTEASPSASATPLSSPSSTPSATPTATPI